MVIKEHWQVKICQIHTIKIENYKSYCESQFIKKEIEIIISAKIIGQTKFNKKQQNRSENYNNY